MITDTVKGASEEAQDWLAQGVNAQTDVIDSVSGLATGYVGAVGGAVSGVVDSSGAAVEKAGSGISSALYPLALLAAILVGGAILL